MMKTIVILFFLTVTGMSTLLAQTKPHQPTKSHIVKHKIDSLKQTTSITGQAGAWENNDDFIYNGFYLQTNTEKQLVRFPLYMGSRLKAAIKSGNTITVNGVSKVSPNGEKEIMMVSITMDGTTIYDSPPPAPAETVTDEFVTGSGKISKLQKNKNGLTTGYLLENKNILKVSPNVASQLSKMAIVGANISYTGLKKAIKNGEAAVPEYSQIECNTITLDGKQYVTKWIANNM